MTSVIAADIRPVWCGQPGQGRGRPIVIRNAMRVDPTSPGEEGTSYLERSPALSSATDYRTGNRAGWGWRGQQRP